MTDIQVTSKFLGIVPIITVLIIEAAPDLLLRAISWGFLYQVGFYKRTNIQDEGAAQSYGLP
jgi:hypothetical protein